ELLQRYISVQDQDAFSKLLQRYASLVKNICRRELQNLVDIEDACQTTFLILAQRASTIRKQQSLRCWLHGVAIRVSKAMKRRSIRLESKLRQCQVAQVVTSAAEIMADADLQELIRCEVEGLPEEYRIPLRLCYWHGQSREEMANTLGWTKGQVKGQLERAKRRLRTRLDQRGVHLFVPLGVSLSVLGLATILPGIIYAAGTATALST
ncbi:MAG TPA: sigma-70 family RNA polymerase sigma factor, partial [Gemmatales bacterium]|nr:sigma-70 family RNA polymerase sigma factor [Gemmatales bacterium]